MLAQQQELQFSSFSRLYDLIIPKDNLLRKISELIDFTFVYEELLDKYCSTNGRMAESPVRMFKYLLLKTIYTISDVDVVERSRYDMSFKYFLDMTPEDEVINPSSLTKFRKLRLKDTDLLNLLIGRTVTIAIEKGLEPLAKVIFEQKDSNISIRAKAFLNDKVANIEEALQGARDIIAEWVNENVEARNAVRKVFEREAFVYAKVKKNKEEIKNKRKTKISPIKAARRRSTGT